MNIDIPRYNRTLTQSQNQPSLDIWRTMSQDVVERRHTKMKTNVNITPTPPLRTPRELGLVIRARRRALEMSQQELARAIGASRAWVVAIERGKPRAEVGLLLRTIRALGLELHLGEAEASVSETGAAAPAGLDVDIDAVVDAAKDMK